MEFSRQECRSISRILKYWRAAISSSRGSSLTQGSNPSLPRCRRVLYCLSHQGSHWYTGALRIYNSSIQRRLWTRHWTLPFTHSLKDSSPQPCISALIKSNLQMRKPRYTEVKQLDKGHVAKKKKKKSSLWFNSNRRFFASVLSNFLTLTTGQHAHQDNLLSSPFHAAMIFVVVFMWNESRMGKPFINVCPSPSEAISSQEQPPSRWAQPYYMIDFPCSLNSCRVRIYQRVGWHGQSWPL